MEHAVPTYGDFNIVGFFARVELGDGASFGVRGAADDEDDDFRWFFRALRGKTIPDFLKEPTRGLLRPPEPGSSPHSQKSTMSTNVLRIAESLKVS